MKIETKKWAGVMARVMTVTDEDKKKDKYGCKYFGADFWHHESSMDVIIDGDRVIKDRING